MMSRLQHTKLFDLLNVFRTKIIYLPFQSHILTILPEIQLLQSAATLFDLFDFLAEFQIHSVQAIDLLLVNLG